MSKNPPGSNSRRFIEVERLVPRKRDMPSTLNYSSIKAVFKVLSKEIGRIRGLYLLSKAGLTLVINGPRWNPEFFELKDEEEAKHFERIFNEMRPLIFIFEYLKKMYDEARADEITAKMAVPIALPYLIKSFHRIENPNHINQVRQLSADYLGDGKGFEWTEKVSEDGLEVRYHFTKCVYILVLKIYGLKTFAAYSCLADHILFDNVMPEFVFGRKHTIGVGDTYCDHILKIRSSDEIEKDEANYEDCYKISGGRELVQYWEENYKINKGKFRF
ncbi:MAG: L-2-amino-thiazoline-4-carboxylic acid hydrolase [Promethearchaeota archaeon]